LQVAIAEDRVLLREGLVRLLGDAGFDVIARCRDADEPRHLLKAQQPDVVIVDIRLPPTHTDEDYRPPWRSAPPIRGSGCSSSLSTSSSALR